MNCARIIELLDAYIDSGDNPDVEQHLEGCQGCSTILANRIALRDRLRAAVRRVEAPANLQARIHDRIAQQARSNRLQWVPMATAAAVMLSVGLVGWYQTGHLRLTPASQEAYIASIAPRVSPIMQVGLTQHVHCAVFRQYPSEQPSVAELTKALGPQYSGLVLAMQQHLPSDFRVVMAHLCQRRGRSYIHVIARHGSSLISLLLTKKTAGEAFEANLRAVEAGTALYTSQVQRFNIAGFQTSDYLVYLVSDMDQDGTLAALTAMAPQVQTVLHDSHVTGLQHRVEPPPELGYLFAQTRDFPFERRQTVR
ncbi:MAG: hypothetical protein ABSB15_18430 [Bryobacteraceae bacterium]|jgi:hypothetical protein